LFLAVHLLAYVVILAVALIPKVHPRMGKAELWHDTVPALPFVAILIFSVTHFRYPCIKPPSAVIAERTAEDRESD
jgi:hypothetical protein